jgi:8-oxo-dGTP pyrophosphatase MutT (NUDIX family)
MIYKEKPIDFQSKADIVACYIQYNHTFILLQRQPFKTHGGKWGLPAGKAEPEEDLYVAILREVFEETGLIIERNELKRYQTLWVENNGYEFVYHTFGVDLDTLPDIILSQSEHQDYQWTTLEESFEMDLIHDLDECNRLFCSPKL